MFIEIVSGCCWDTPLEVVTLSLPWPPLEVGGWYRSGSDACSGTTGVGCGNNLGDSGGRDSTIHQFSKIVRTASIAASCGLHILVGTSCCYTRNSVTQVTFPSEHQLTVPVYRPAINLT